MKLKKVHLSFYFDVYLKVSLYKVLIVIRIIGKKTLLPTVESKSGRRSESGVPAAQL